MALFLYRCECGEYFEVLSQEPLPECKCGGELELVLCPPAIHWRYTR